MGVNNLLYSDITNDSGPLTMNKDEYLKELRKLLRKLPKEDREDIISDYEEHFTIGMEKGRTEEEISNALGNPKTLARQIKSDQMVKKAEDKPSLGSIIEAILAIMGLGLFNLIFVAVPVLVVVAIIITLFVLGFVMIFGGIYWVLFPLLSFIFPKIFLSPATVPNSSVFMNNLFNIMGGFAVTIGGVLLVAAMVYVSKWFYELMIRYLKLNLRIIKGRKRDI